MDIAELSNSILGLSRFEIARKKINSYTSINLIWVLYTNTEACFDLQPRTYRVFSLRVFFLHSQLFYPIRINLYGPFFSINWKMTGSLAAGLAQCIGDVSQIRDNMARALQNSNVLWAMDGKKEKVKFCWFKQILNEHKHCFAIWKCF